MPSVNSSGTASLQTSSGETTLATITAAGTYQLVLDINDLANAEIVVARIDAAALVAGTVRTQYRATFENAQGTENAIKVSPPIVHPHTGNLLFTLDVTAASAVSIPWSINDLS